MKKDAKTFKKVAKNCSRFSAADQPSYASEDTFSATNSTASHSSAKNSSSGNVSCKNCSHYDPKKVCSLDLYQEIVENHNF